MNLFTKQQQESYKNAKICYIWKEKYVKKCLKDKKSRKVRDYCHYTGEYRGAVHNICNSKQIVLKKVPIVFHNGSMFISLS